MTEIEVPSWVVDVGMDELGCFQLLKSNNVNQRAAVEAILTAALGAWVVPVPQSEVRYYKTRTLYDLRQEKPE